MSLPTQSAGDLLHGMTISFHAYWFAIRIEKAMTLRSPNPRVVSSNHALLYYNVRSQFFYFRLYPDRTDHAAGRFQPRLVVPRQTNGNFPVMRNEAKTTEKFNFSATRQRALCRKYENRLKSLIIQSIFVPSQWLNIRNCLPCIHTLRITTLSITSIWVK